MSAPATIATTGCIHCGAAMEDPSERFCCAGCALAAEIVHEAGLDRYYAEREAVAPRPAAHAASWTGVETEDLGDGTRLLRLAVDGLRCSACVWVTEGLLNRTPGIEQATVSYATGRARVRFYPESIDVDRIAARIARLGYRPRPLLEAAKPDRDLLLRLGVSAFCAANVMLLSASVYAGWWDAMDPRYAALFHWTSLVLATPVALWSAIPFFRGAWQGLRAGVLGMDVPVALGIGLMYGHGLFATFLGQDSWLDSLAMLVTLLLAGRVVEARGRRSAAEAAMALSSRVPKTARRLGEDGGVSVVSTNDLRAGDRVACASGEEIAVDGVVLGGTGRVQQALLTGESEPVLVGTGDAVAAGAVLADGALEVRVTAVGDETRAANLARRLADALDRGVHLPETERLALVFSAAVLAVAALTGAAWTYMAGPSVALGVVVALLVVACPCALALAWPLTVAVGLGAVARRGAVLRSGDAFLRLAEIEVVALDKTGTATAGEPRVVGGDDTVLRLAAAVERWSIHPIARAIVAEAGRRSLPLARCDEVVEEIGRGISGRVDGRLVHVSSGAPGEVDVVVDGERAGTLRLRDVARDDARTAIVALRRLGVSVALVSGDRDAIARRIADELGIDDVVAEVSPEGKESWVRAQGRRVLFVGDGLNDGPALAAAHVGLAMGQGAPSSLLVADGVVLADGLAPVVAALRAAKAVRAVVRGNWMRSIAYNAVAVTVAALGLMNPLIAAVLMPLSSGLVIWGAFGVERRMRRSE